MTSSGHRTRPSVVLMPVNDSMRQLFEDILALEEYRVVTMATADRVVDALTRGDGPFLVLMDNYHLNPEAMRLMDRLAERPELQRKVRLLGATAGRKPRVEELDSFLLMPFTAEEFVDRVEHLCAQLAVPSEWTR